MIVLRLLMMIILNKFKNQRKHKVVFKLNSTNKKFCTVKFTDDQMLAITTSANMNNMTLEEFFMDAIRTIGKN